VSGVIRCDNCQRILDLEVECTACASGLNGTVDIVQGRLPIHQDS
jgi:hypothetical protein